MLTSSSLLGLVNTYWNTRFAVDKHSHQAYFRAFSEPAWHVVAWNSFYYSKRFIYRLEVIALKLFINVCGIEQIFLVMCRTSILFLLAILFGFLELSLIRFLLTKVLILHLTVCAHSELQDLGPILIYLYYSPFHFNWMQVLIWLYLLSVLSQVVPNHQTVHLEFGGLCWNSCIFGQVLLKNAIYQTKVA